MGDECPARAAQLPGIRTAASGEQRRGGLDDGAASNNRPPSRGEQRQQQQQPGAPWSPLSSGLQAQRSRGSLGGGGNMRSSRDDLLTAEEAQQQQQQEQQQPPWLQQQQQQAGDSIPHAAAYVSVLQASSGREAAQHSPRSPSRLRYVRKDSTAAGGPTCVAACAAVGPTLPDFLQVQELAPGILREDEVEIVHQEADEAARAADVDAKIIRQVDDLVAYFNGLFQDDQLDISMLQQEVTSRDMELSKKNLLIQQLMASKHQQSAQAAYVDPGLWTAVKRSWRCSRCWWVMALLLLVALVLVIALPAGLVKRPGPAPPAFALQPQLLSATASSLDFSVAVSRAAVVHYVLLPRAPAGSSSVWGKFTSRDVQAAAAGWNSNSLESSAAACGSLYIAAANARSSFSVIGVNSSECAQQAAQAVAGGAHNSCSRCPMLGPDTTYEVLLVAAADGALMDKPARIQAATLPSSASRAPQVRSGGAAARGTGSSAFVDGATEATFDLTFSTASPGSIRFVVLYAQMYARFVDTYLVFDNTVTDPSALMSSSRDSFQDGLVARGQITVRGEQGGNFTCTIGSNAHNGTCACTPAATCVQEAACFGALCDYSRLSLAPSTAYKVVLMPVSLDGMDAGTPLQLPAFSTSNELTPPQMSDALGINPVVGPNSFSVLNISQDKPGFAYLLVTRPSNQVNSQVPPGTATRFQRVPGAQRSHGGRQLTASQGSITVLPREVGARASGAAFVPPCRAALPCEQFLGSAQDYTSPGAEVLVHSKCVPIAKISEQATELVTSLANNTLYRVVVVPKDRNNNQDAYSAFVRTQDLTPPLLTVLDTPPPDFDQFTVVAELDEPGTVWATLLLASDAAQGTATVTCAPRFTSPLVGAAAIAVPSGATAFNITFSSGLAANTDYLLRLIAGDTPGNCQTAFTDLPVHTLDNAPPNTLAFDVVHIGGSYAGLQLTLDEPSTASFAVMPRGTPCPPPAALSAAATATPAGAVAAGNFSVPAGNTPALFNVSGLTSETNYTACVIAADVTRLRNQQASGASRDFRTLDVTPPVLTVAVAPGLDANFTCDRASFLCSLAFSAALDEPGSITWALAPSAALPEQLPTPAQLMAATNLSALLPLAGRAPTGAIQVPRAGAGGNTTLPGLPSETNYTLLLAARDVTQPSPNYLPRLQALALAAPDVTPPVFTDVRLAAAADTSFALNTTLNEASVVHFVVVRHPSAEPTPAQVASGVAANDSSPASAGSSPAGRNVFAVFAAEGLSAGTWYDVYLVARDAPAGNLQTRVTNITHVRTTDSVLPEISALAATFTPPMSLALSFTVSKAGALWLAPRRASQPAPTAQEVLDEVAARSVAQANFTAVVAVPAAAVPDSHTLCVADGDQLVVYAVARDNEGQFPGRQDNTSPMKSAVVLLQPPATDASCPSLAHMQPGLAFAAPVGLPGLSPPGLLLGARTTTATGAGAHRMQQDVVAFSNAAVLGQSRQLLASLPAASGASGALTLPGSVGLAMQPLPPASISIILASSVLVPDANADDGATLRVSYQLRDAAGRAQVDASALALKPVLNYADGVTPPSGAQAANNILPDCGLGSLGAASGVGECAVLLPRILFPASGSVAARVVLRVLIGGAQAASARADGLRLQAPPALPAFAPSSQPGLLLTLPYRAVHFGETVRVTLAAVNPLMQGITGFTVPLRYDKSVLEFREVRGSALWQPLAVSTVADGGNYEVAVLSAGRAAGQADAAYRADMNGIGLADVFFSVKARAGTAASVLTVVNTPSAAVAAAASLWPSWPAPFAQFNSFSGASGSAGSLSIEGIASLGMWAWADSYDVLNTAALTGQQVSTALRGVLVRNWGSSPASTNSGDAISACAVTAPSAAAGAPRPASVAVDSLRRLCSVSVNAANSVPAKGMAVTLTIQDPALAAQSAQVLMDVWYPAGLALAAADATLNSVLPLNAAPTSPACASFQSTPLQLSANWTNGGPGPGDTLLQADVTGMVTFNSNDTAVAQVYGSVVKGMSPGAATITTSASPSLQTLITVSAEPACLVQLHTVATTGVALAAAALGNATTNSSQAAGGAPAAAAPPSALQPNSKTSLAWTPQQELAWEDSTALVLSYARFTDGSIMDVTDKAAVAAALPPAAAALPFSLRSDNSTGLSWLTVNITVGTSAPCEQYLHSTWAVCSNSVQLGSGTGSVRVTLPAPAAVAQFSASPAAITSADDPARLGPMLLATSADLDVQVAFDDGSVRDMSRDARVSFAMAPGSTLCGVEAAPDGSFQVVAAASARSVSGSCVIIATVTFGGSTAPLTATTSVSLVGLSRLAVYALPPGVAAVPLPPPAASLVVGDSMVLLRCDATNYDQRTLWSYGVLSNCTGNASCPLVDLNSRQYLQLNSSDDGVAQILPGTGLNSYPLLDNHLVPLAPGSSAVSSSFAAALDEAFTLAVKGTFQQPWPSAAVLSDTAARVDANMSEAALGVTYLMVPSAQLSLLSVPPIMPSLAQVQAGVTLVPDAAQGPFFLTANASGLTPGTNYTVLTAVSFYGSGPGSSVASSPTVTALNGLLVPDTTAPSFTKAAVTAVTPNTGGVGASGGGSSGAPDGTFSMQVELGLDEGGRVYYAVYGDPACISADPSPAEIISGVNLADVQKCACDSRFCAAAAFGSVPVAGGGANGSASVSLRATLPPFPFNNLGADASCSDYLPTSFASLRHAVYFVAEDQLPTYKGWSSVCAMPPPPVPAPPAGPCPAVHIGRCTNTPPPTESVNRQAPPYADVALAASPHAPIPARSPIKGVAALVDPVEPGFVDAAVESTGSSVVWSFRTTKPGLVQWRLVEQVTHVIAKGLLAVVDASQALSVPVSRKCSGDQLVPGTAYALWYNMTDIYGAATDVSILKITL